MTRGMYIAATAMVARTQKQDTVANNLANVNTAGFKTDGVLFRQLYSAALYRRNDYSETQDVSRMPWANGVGHLEHGVLVDRSYTNFRQGAIRSTGNPLDLALEGDGFFVLQTPAGERYTRNGSFTIDSEGFLANSLGNRVRGENGSIRIEPTAAEFQVSPDGTVLTRTTMNAVAEAVDRIKLVDFDKPYHLRKVGDSLMTTVDGARTKPPASIRVRQGALEMSLAEPVREMVDMIEALRAYEASAKAVSAHDNITQQAVSRVSRVA